MQKICFQKLINTYENKFYIIEIWRNLNFLIKVVAKDYNQLRVIFY